MIHNYQTDEKSLMASSGTTRVTEKPISQDQQQEPPLKCPRCDSSNTKFCYYNNYSLSQPRHFCKACKRYWTKRGTLRNVPVGGGCRKNKRIRRSSASSSSTADISSSSTCPASSAPLPISASKPQAQSQTHTQINPLFYGLPINPSELNLPFPRLFGSRISSIESSLSVYDNNNSMISSTGILGGHGEHGFVNSSNSLLSSYPVLRSSSATASPSTSTTLASLIASSLEQQKFNISGGLIKNITKHEGCNSNFMGMTPYEDLQMTGNIILENGVKMEGESQNRSNWNDAVSLNRQNRTEEMVNINYSTSDTSFPWNSAWMDPSSMGSSVPSLI